MLILLGCKPSVPASHSVQQSNDDPPVFQPQGHGTVQLEIDFPSDLELALFQIRGNESYLAENLISQSSLNSGDRTTGQSHQTFELESGLFVVKAKGSKFAVPVPALALKPNSKLSIEIRQPPAQIEGWCWIPPGPALIGDTLGVGREDERPAKIVEVDGFWMAEKEVTNRQYAKFLSKQNEIVPGWIDLESRKCLIRPDTESEGFSIDTSVVSAGKMPVVMVSLQGAQAYCQWL